MLACIKRPGFPLRGEVVCCARTERQETGCSWPKYVTSKCGAGLERD